MNMTTEIHPDVVLESLLAKGARAQRRRNLAQMHELCRGQYDVGSRDFSLPSIGRLCEAQGLLKGRALLTPSPPTIARSLRRGQRTPVRLRQRHPSRWPAMNI